MAKRRRRNQPAAAAAAAATTAMVVLGGGSAALALPEGMVVTGGQLELTNPSAGQAVINQGTQRAAADFQSFNIGASERVQIVQPSASSAFLGRVVGGNITEIHGRLDANGRVMLVNPAGILVGPTGTINTAAFAATTLNVDPAKFMEGGRLELKNLPGLDPNAAVINQGTITVADGGYAALLAPHVVNEGLITARLGQVQLAAGTAATLDISGDGLLGVTLDPGVAASITNTGTIAASYVRLGGGEASALVAATVNLAGLIEARSGVDALGLEPVLQASSISVESAGPVTLSGTLDASSTTASGGSITVQGDHIAVRSTARLEATGSTGGGQVLIGGSWQNSNPSVRQATMTTIEAGAVVDASATSNGSGGTIVAWSDISNPNSVTTVAGTLLAKGGAQGGDGGRIETSGHDLRVNGISISTAAPLGATGEWLLDPYDITISSGTPSGTSGTYTANANSAVIDVNTLTTALNSNNVTVYTGDGTGTPAQSGNITVSAPISSNSTKKLTLQAAGSIVIDQDITRSGAGGLTLIAGSGSVSGNGNLILGGGTTLSLTPNLTVANNIQLIGDATVELKLEINYLIVGGGGGGGSTPFTGGGGGGGGGQVLQGSVSPIGGSYAITVGAGGAGGNPSSSAGHNGGAGGSSSGLGITAAGGQGGLSTGFSNPQNPQGGKSGEGYSGGSGIEWVAGGGGGGAGAPGTSATASSGSTGAKGGNGGAGVASVIEGTATTYGGGGGGGARISVSPAGLPGSGSNGGGNGGTAATSYNGNPGGVNTGGGGGGGSADGTVKSGGSGGSGIVILKYAGAPVATGGTISTSTVPGSTIHKFTSTNTFVVPELTATLSGVISNTSAGNLTINAPSATVNLTGKNTYTGDTTIAAGTMKLAGDGAIGWNGANPADYASNIANSGTLVFASSLNKQTVSGNISGTGTLTVNASPDTSSSNQIFGGGSGSFVPTSSPTVIASNTTVQEALTLINGARISGTAVGSSTVGSVHFRTYDASTDKATFQIQAVDGSTSKGVLVELQQSGSNVTARVLQAGTTTSGALGRDIANWSSQTVATAAGTGEVGIDQLFTADRVVLTGNNSYTGPTNITSGVLELASSGSLGYLVATPSAPVYSGNTAFGARGALVFNSTASHTLSGAFSGTGEILKFGDTSLSFTGTGSTYTGKLAATGGSLIVDGAGVLSTGTHSGGVALSGDATFRYSSTANQTMSGDIIGRGRVIKEENSNLTLSGYKRWVSDTSNSGDTDVRAGTLTLSGSSAISGITDSLGGYVSSTTAGGGSLIEIGSGATLAIAGGSTLEFNGATVRFGSSGGGTVSNASSNFINRNTTYRSTGGAQNQITSSSGTTTLDAGPITFVVTRGTDAGADLQISAVLSGPAAVTKLGGGILSYRANNTYSGTTSIDDGTLVIAHNAPAAFGAGFSGPGNLRIEPQSSDFTGAFSTSSWSFGSTLSSLTIGKASSADGSSDQNLTLAAALTIDGPVTLYGGSIAIDAPLTTASSTVVLKGSGTVNDGTSGYLVADKLTLLGGTVTLDHISNTVNTLAASGTAAITLVNSQALTIGAVGATAGINASGAVRIETLSGDLSISESVASSNTSSSAVVLNAGKSEAAGTASGGNIVLTSGKSVTVGSGGRATLYSGSIAGSTNLASMSGLGSASGRFRYNADETTDFSTGGWTALSSGAYAIYREQPTARVTNMVLSMTYGDPLPGIGATGTLNGDEFLYSITGRVNSTSGQIKVGNYVFTSNLSGLGYQLIDETSGSVFPAGSLAVQVRPLNITATQANNKTYNKSDAATLTSLGTLNGIVSGDVVSVAAGYTAAFDNANAGTAKTVTVSGLSLAGADASNYSLPASLTTTANIDQRAITVTAGAKTKDYGDSDPTLTYAFTSGPLASGDAFSGALSRSAGENAGTYAIEQNTLNVDDGNSGNNYTITYAGANLTINPRTVSLSASKTYDGTTDLTGFVSIATGVGAETLSYTAAVASDRNVATAGKYISAITLANATDGSGGLASNYALPVLNASNAPVTINARTVGLSASKTFDGYKDLTGAVTITTGVDGESLGYSGAAGSDAHVATAAKFISAITLTNGTGGVASNYALPALNAATATLTINPAPLTATAAITAAVKTYDGLLDATGSSVTGSLSGTLNGDAITLDTSGLTLLFNDAHVATLNKTIAANGSVALGTLTPGGVGAKDGTAGNAVAGALSDYVISAQPTLTPVAGTIVARTLTPTLSNTGVTKVYDGQTSAPSGFVPAYTFGGLIAGDSTATLSHVAAVYDSPNVVTASKITVSGLAIAGITGSNASAVSDYVLDATSKDVAATITPATLAVTFTSANKTYDGSNTATVSSSDNRISGDTLTINYTSAVFADKNVDASKSVLISGLSLTGPAASNYALPSTTATATASITRLSSATWIGGSSGHWFDPANWAVTGNLAQTGVVPDLANVAAVVIPSGSTVNFDTAAAVAPADANQPVNLDSVGSAGSIAQASGTLNVGSGGLALQAYTQTGGSFAASGAITLGSLVQTGGSLTANADLTVTSGYAQGTSGSITVAGNTTITDSTGGVVLGNLTTTGPASITSTGGSLTQAAGTSLISNGALNLAASEIIGGISQAAAISLNNASNNFVGVVSTSGSAISLMDGAGGLTLGATTAASSLSISSIGGAISQVSPHSVSNAITVVGPASFSASNGGAKASITLLNPDNDFGGAVSLDGSSIGIRDRNALTLGVVSSSANLSITSAGALDLGTATVGGGLVATSGNGAISQSGPLVVSGAASLDAGTGSIALGSAGNNFVGAVTAMGNTISLSDDSGGLSLAGITAANGLNVTSRGGAIVQQTPYTQASAIRVLNGGTSLTATTSTGGPQADITLNGPDNDFGGPVSLSGANVSIRDANALSLGALNTSGDLSIVNAGPLNLGSGSIGGNLSAVSGNGAISQVGALRAAGRSEINAGSGDVVLNNAANDFIGPLRVQAARVDLVDANALSLDLTASGSVSVRNVGGLELKGSASSLSVDSLGPVLLERLAIAGETTVRARGSISQVAPITIGGKALFDAGSNGIALTDPANRFSGGMTMVGAPAKAAGFGVQYTSPEDIAEAYGDRDFTRAVSVLNPGLQQNQPMAAGQTSNPSEGVLPTSSSGSAGTAQSSNQSSNADRGTAGVASGSAESGDSKQSPQSGPDASPVAVREGPLDPNFRVEEQVPERYTMGRGSLQVEPGSEVCVNPAGCGGGINANQLSSIEIDGLAPLVGTSDQQPAKPSFNVSSVGQRLLSWLGRTR